MICTAHGWPAGPSHVIDQRKPLNMLWTLAVILLVLWALGFLIFHIAGGLIHILLVIAVVVVVYRLITGRG